jgi:hypothetical protein
MIELAWFVFLATVVTVELIGRIARRQEDRRMAKKKSPVEDADMTALAALGAGIAGAAYATATEQITKRRTQRVIDAIANEIEQLRELQLRRAELDEIIAFRRRRAAALESGAFNLDRDDAIVYTDNELNVNKLVRGERVHHL